MPLQPADYRPMTRRDAELRRFLRGRFGLTGTLRLHRLALGRDLLRAPVNVTLAPVFLLLRLVSWLLGLVGARRAGQWLATRQIFLTTDVSRQIRGDLDALFARLDAEDIGPRSPPETVRRAVDTYVETRNAVAEITTSLLVLLAGAAIFYRATPGVVSLAEPVARMRAQSRAVEDFMLGDWAGGMWYGLFPADLSGIELALTIFVLAVLSSLVTTFAGLIADPVQLWTGIHQRRLTRMMRRLDQQREAAPIGGEHLLARMGDLVDMASSIWRGMR